MLLVVNAVKALSDIFEAKMPPLPPQTPLPCFQIAILCLINASEGVAMNIIWSYVPFLVGQWYNDNELGVYVGLLASSFFVTQSLSAVWWGKLSDRFGRRPILIIGVFGSALSMTLFGWSQSYEVCIAGRLCAGLLNGNLGIVKSYLGEITDQTNRARGFSFLSLIWGVTSILAPAAGGLLAKPAERWSVFQTEFWETHPYLLPSLVSVVVSLSGATVGFFFLPESSKWLSLRSHRRQPASIGIDELQEQQEQQDSAHAIDSPTNKSSGDDSKEQVKQIPIGDEILLLDASTTNMKLCACCPYNSCWRKLWSPVLHTCLLYSMLGFTITQFDELIPLLGEEEPNKGGLGFDTSQIGLLLSIGGGTLLFYQALLFPLVARRLGSHKGYIMGILFAGVVIAFFPTVGMVRASQMEADSEWVFWVFYTCMSFLQKAGSSTAFTFSMMLINDYTPPGKLGTTNGVAQSMVAFSRIFSPTLAGGVWSGSMQAYSLDPYATFIPYLTVTGCCCICAILAYMLPKQEILGFEVV